MTSSFLWTHKLKPKIAGLPFDLDTYVSLPPDQWPSPQHPWRWIGAQGKQRVYKTTRVNVNRHGRFKTIGFTTHKARPMVRDKTRTMQVHRAVWICLVGDYDTSTHNLVYTTPRKTDYANVNPYFWRLAPLIGKKATYRYTPEDFADLTLSTEQELESARTLLLDPEIIELSELMKEESPSSYEEMKELHPDLSLDYTDAEIMTAWNLTLQRSI